jgi:2-succinyl-6-hydroxy-2,4-cyclohexadiene-1-carboxylate synthase
MLKYHARGSPDHPHLIFLHGFLGCKEDWNDILPFFATRYYCIAIDLPGHGASEYCEDIVGAVRALIGINKPTLIGYSMGGRIALQLQPHAKKLAILSAHLGLQTQKEKEERWELDKAWSKKLLHLPFETFLEQWYAQPLFQPLPSLPLRLKNDPKSLSKVILQMSLAHQQYIETLDCPALFLYGENDLKYRDLYCRLPKNAAVEGLSGSGHIIPLSNPSLCAKKILNWLEVDEPRSSMESRCKT